MTRKRAPAREAARHRSGSDVWIDHARVVDEDLEWLLPVERLTLWNVLLPAGFLARMTELRRLDLRGGSAADIQAVNGCDRLEYLALNQIRGLNDLSVLPSLTELRLLLLYGLPRVETVPSLRPLVRLSRVEVGSMGGLTSLDGILDAPNLKELLVIRKMGSGCVDARSISEHPALEQFSWFGEDVPVRTWKQVVDAVTLPPVEILSAENWLDSRT